MLHWQTHKWPWLFSVESAGFGRVTRSHPQCISCSEFFLRGVIARRDKIPISLDTFHSVDVRLSGLLSASVVRMFSCSSAHLCYSKCLQDMIWWACCKANMKANAFLSCRKYKRHGTQHGVEKRYRQSCAGSFLDWIDQRYKFCFCQDRFASTRSCR